MDGKPAYVTMVSQSNASDGWREYRLDGGIVMDIPNSQVIFEELSMPHSHGAIMESYIYSQGESPFG